MNLKMTLVSLAKKGRVREGVKTFLKRRFLTLKTFKIDLNSLVNKSKLRSVYLYLAEKVFYFIISKCYCNSAQKFDLFG